MKLIPLGPQSQSIKSLLSPCNLYKGVLKSRCSFSGNLSHVITGGCRLAVPSFPVIFRLDFVCLLNSRY